MSSSIIIIAFIPLTIWVVFSMYYLVRAKNDYSSINHYIFDSIPGFFTTAGVLGTFLGIAFALWGFNVNDISSSIPQLLSGLTGAFWTSIIGIILSAISSKFVSVIQVRNEKKQTEASNELVALNRLVELTKGGNKLLVEKFDKLYDALVGENDNSIGTELTKLRSSISDSIDENSLQIVEQTEALKKVQKSLGGDDDTSLLTQTIKLRTQLSDSFKELNIKIEKVDDSLSGDNEHSISSLLNALQKESGQISSKIDSSTKDITNTLIQTNEIMKTKFDEFAELLAKNNTEILVKAIEEVIGEFNVKLSELIERLVKENFEELNNSVKRLNDWQKENKEEIQRLIEQYRSVSDELKTTTETLKNVANITQMMVDSESLLQQLIDELRKVMIDDRKFQEIINKVKDNIEQLTQSSATLKTSSSNLENTSFKLEEFVNKEEVFNKSIENLIERLKEIEEIKDLSDKFWDNIEKNMNKSVNILSQGNEHLQQQIAELDNDFNQRLNQSFSNLDRILQAMTTDYHTKTLDILNKFDGGDQQ